MKFVTWDISLITINVLAAQKDALNVRIAIFVLLVMDNLLWILSMEIASVAKIQSKAALSVLKMVVNA